EALEKILTNYRNNEGNIIPILQDLEGTFGYIPEEAVNWFSKKLDIPASRFYGVATFYTQFNIEPKGKNVITVCTGTTCHIKGAKKLLHGLRKQLNLSEGEDTTDDKKFTVNHVACDGTCSMAPVILINKKVYGKITANKLSEEIETLRRKTGG
ncbi:MAG: NADH-quinone oxidoreductase subunit NuoE family protein, partial [Thermodesulfovibrionales bacterium]